ncbi:hypothetical protein M23134_00965 [Microscilla marina ATCC 23134]|uniref:Uncharacterized protein n=1 Tax=Microscilla marina ATCC 23134 TaxID=313606 RepID=A1ZZP2_MICM2|nr:hypothetical protein M23134_00965 [Microscilla marina ATCC 23134]
MRSIEQYILHIFKVDLYIFKEFYFIFQKKKIPLMNVSLKFSKKDSFIP